MDIRSVIGGARLILRAEFCLDGRWHVGHTVEISPGAILVHTSERPQVGTPVILRLSFPRLVQPLELSGRVRESVPGNDPGDPDGFIVDLIFKGDADRERLLALLPRAEGSGEAPGPAVPPAAPAGAAAAPGTPTFRVLLVEDNRLIRDMFSYGLRKFFQTRKATVIVDSAEDGLSAWKQLQTSAYELAIVDYYLPVLDGSRLVQRIRADERLASLPVVAISVGGSEAREALLAAGADVFLDKPIMIHDLFNTLGRFLTDRRAP